MNKGKVRKGFPFVHMSKKRRIWEEKGNSIEKSRGGIGIVPYIYKDAYNYYFALWQAQQKNENKVVQQYVPAVKEIVIPRPQRKVKTRPLFSFLDEEMEAGNE